MDRTAEISRAYRALAEGRHQEAAVAAQDVLRRFPGDPAALTLLGRLALAGNDPLLAVQAFQQVLGRHAGAATAWLDLAAALRELNDTGQALAAAGQAARLDPTRVGAWALLGNIHLDAGDPDQAREAFDRALGLEPSSVAALRGLSRCGRLAPDDEPVLTMQSLLERPGLPDRDRALLHYTLAETCLQAGMTEDFERHLLQANRTQRAYTPGDCEDYAVVFDRLEAALDAGTFDRVPRAAPGSPVPLFIVGMPRSGTSLVEQLLAADPGVAAGGEVNYAHGPLTRAVERLTGRPFPDGIDRLDVQQVEALAAGFTRRLAATARGRALVTDKTPGNFHLLGLLAALFPAARIIHVARDPMDTCFSILRQPFAEASPHTCDMELLAYVYGRYDRLMRRWASWRPDTFVTVRYEDLVANPGAECKRLFEYCGLDWRDEVLDASRRKAPLRTFSAEQARQPIHTHSIAAWTRHAGMLAPLQEALAREFPGALTGP